MAVELFGEFACLNLNHRPEIRLWMERTYLFEPTRNDLRDVTFNEVKRARKTGRGRQNAARLESAPRILRRPELAMSLSKA